MSPRTKEQFAQIRKQSSDQIADAALELFAKNGFHLTSIERIAKMAGVSKGLIYNYFDTKDDLLRYVVSSAIEVGDQVLEEAENASLSPIDQLCKVIDDLFKLVGEKPRYWKLMVMLSMQEEVAKKFEDITNQHAMANLGKLAGLLRDMDVPDFEVEAMTLAATFDGVLLHFIHMGEKYPLTQIAQHLKLKIAKLAKTKEE